MIGLNFSSATTPELLLKTFEQYCEFRKTPNGTVMSPIQLGKWLVFFCDEINLPDYDKYGMSARHMLLVGSSDCAHKMSTYCMGCIITYTYVGTVVDKGWLPYGGHGILLAPFLAEQYQTPS